MLVQDTSPAPRRERPAAETGPAPFAADPPAGRVFAGRRTIRSTDVTPAGVFRLDALARYLQDVAEDDVAATGWQAPYGWRLLTGPGTGPEVYAWLLDGTDRLASGRLAH